MRFGGFVGDLLSLDGHVFDLINTGGDESCPILECGESVVGFVDGCSDGV